MRITKRALIAPALLCMWSGWVPVLAQETGSSQSAGMLEEILVTAQRRVQSVMEVPLSIMAASSKQLEDAGITEMVDLQMITPGLNVFEGNGFTQAYIRGVGNQVFAADPSVATFIDDVPLTYGTMGNNLLDVERIEILKGAQGGLYGRNATGGVINIITRQPATGELSGELQTSYGNYDATQLSGLINIPLGDRAAMLLTAEHREHDAYFDNQALSDPYTAAMFPGGSFIGSAEETAGFLNSGVDNGDIGKDRFWTVGAKVLIEATDNLTLRLAADYSEKDGSLGNQQITETPGYTQGLLEGTLIAALGANPQLPVDFIKEPSGKFNVRSGTVGLVGIEDYGLSGTVVWSQPGVDLTSITAYRSNEFRNYAENTGAPVPLSTTDVNYDRSYYYQEFRGESTFEGPLRLIGGATYLDSSTDTANDFMMLRPLAQFPIARSTTDVESWSVYAEAVYDLTEDLSLTASGRFVSEKNETSFNLSGSQTNMSEDKFLPAATLSYSFASSSMVYARWARGFKAGGTNFVADVSVFPDPSRGSTFGGETVDTYEVGYRAGLLNNSVQVTAAIFYNDFEDLQVATQSTDPSISIAIINAGAARTYGAEASIAWRAAENLTLSMNGGYLDAEYDDFASPGDPLFEPFDLSDERMTNSPEWQFSLNANLDQPITDGLVLTGNLLASYTSSVIWSHAANDFLPTATQGGYWLSNARLGLRTSDDRYEVAMFVNNLFDKEYAIYGLSGSAIGTQSSWGHPRIFGASISMRF